MAVAGLLEMQITGGDYFDYNMRSGLGVKASGSVIEHQITGDVVTITINQDIITGFIIYYDFTSDVEEGGDVAGMNIGSITPNPADEATSITYSVPTVSNTKVEIYDALGNRVTTLYNGVGNQGVNTLNWDIRNENVPNGVYTVKLTHNGASITEKLVVVR